jgi:hypothetical protein
VTLLTKGLAGLLVVVLAYGGVTRLRLHWAQAGLKSVAAERDAAYEANASNVRAIGALMDDNARLLEVLVMVETKRRELEDESRRIKDDAERAKRELARVRAEDRESPPCAELLDRSLAVCPDLVRRLWPDAVGANGDR